MQAVGLLRQGIAKDVQGWHSVLYSELTKLLLEDQRLDEAIDAAWQALTHDPREYSFFSLRNAAEAGGKWKASRKMAFDLLHQEIREELENAPPGRFFPKDGSRRVQIHLREGEIEDASHARCTFGWNGPTDLELALIRCKEHPEDSIPIVRNAALKALEPTGRDATPKSGVLACSSS